MIEFEDPRAEEARIIVVGVGGGGGNALNAMALSGLKKVELVVANTDMQALKRNTSPIKIQLGQQLTRGLGAGASPEAGREAALESQEEIAQALYGADMVFVTAGMGGGTGTGAASVIAQKAKNAGILTVGVVTKPFEFEGRKRMMQAEEGILALKEVVDALIVIPNERLLDIIGNRTPLKDAFAKVDEVLMNAVSGIAEVIDVGGLVNVDFADVRTIMADTGPALMGTGCAQGEGRALEAAKMAISSPLLENISIEGATGILVNVTGSSNLGLHEVREAVGLVEDAADKDANVIFGAVIDEEMGDRVKVTVIATGIERVAPGSSALTSTPSEARRRNSRVVARRPQREVEVASRVWDEPAYLRKPGSSSVIPVPQALSSHFNGNNKERVMDEAPWNHATPLPAGANKRSKIGSQISLPLFSENQEAVALAKGEVNAPNSLSVRSMDAKENVQSKEEEFEILVQQQPSKKHSFFRLAGRRGNGKS